MCFKVGKLAGAFSVPDAALVVSEHLSMIQ